MGPGNVAPVTLGSPGLEYQESPTQTGAPQLPVDICGNCMSGTESPMAKPMGNGQVKGGFATKTSHFKGKSK